MKKTVLIVVLFLFLLVVGSSTVGFVWFMSELKAPSTDPQTHSVLITKGSSAEQIANKLFEAKVIKNVFVFRAYVKYTKQASALPVGQFEIPGNLSVSEVISFLKKGPQEVWVTFPEGMRREQYPERISNALSHTDSQARAFRDTFLEDSKNEEGYLFPETYLIPKDITATKMVSILVNTLKKKAPNTTKDAVILASLLERETRSDSEKPMIAGILMNRIRLGMPLQVDATVQYAKANLSCEGTGSPCADWWPTVYLDDYKLKSPYNTYVISGLPPAPIPSPGLTSLQAAQNPADSDYLYYIHDKSGAVHYAKTYEEHLQNVQNYLR